MTDRLAFLLDWAQRDPVFGMAQAERDEAQHPGTVAALRERLEQCPPLSPSMYEVLSKRGRETPTGKTKR